MVWQFSVWTFAYFRSLLNLVSKFGGMLYVVCCMWILYVNVERMCISLDTLTQRNTMLWDVKTQTQNVLTDNQSIDSPKENSNSTKTKIKIKTKIKNLTNNFKKTKYDQNQFELI